MKIGILTYHRSQNYGAMLQAVALRHQLEAMGHDARFVDYWPEYHRRMYAIFPAVSGLKSGARGWVRQWCKGITLYHTLKKRIGKNQAFIRQYIEPYCLPYSASERYDMIVYGSDQIWRKQGGLRNHFNPVYFGENVLRTRRHVSYAASMGIISLDENDKNMLREWLSGFSKVSVRERDLQSVLKHIGIRSEVVLDPTLLLTDEEWTRILPIKPLVKEKYVLHYRLQAEAFDDMAIKRYADAHGCRLITVLGWPCRCRGDVFSTMDPVEFLSLIKYAECVFTSSYHGLMFSLIFKRNFFASFRENAGRARTILGSLGIEHRLFPTKAHDFGNLEDLDYKVISPKIDYLRDASVNFLKSL